MNVVGPRVDLPHRRLVDLKLARHTVDSGLPVWARRIRGRDRFGLPRVDRRRLVLADHVCKRAQPIGVAVSPGRAL